MHVVFETGRDVSKKAKWKFLISNSLYMYDLESGVNA